eukprot:TRINITY_DN47747_c0_g1_i1.p2 TRINITY_DN47747_c0_g1~~TRINITY_DN47747_c0_g1_i1.p2  ORF type:complete len:333 (+),score=56.41 TRINITY_DN47747_c0_g1_i1:51-1001(+)
MQWPAQQGASWCTLLEGKTLSVLWECLQGAAIVQLSSSHRELWLGGLELVPGRLPSRTLFALLTSTERGAALRALPAVEGALLFENFSRPWDTLGDNGLILAAFLSASDSRGGPAELGNWCLGPGIFVLPSMERCLANAPQRAGAPLSVWSMKIWHEDMLCDLDPPGLVWSFPRPVRPTRLSFRCRASASRPRRCGGVLTLAQGLGNDKGPESPAIFVHFTCDPDARCISVQHGSGRSTTLSHWRNGEWCTICVRLDWELRQTHWSVSKDAAAGSEASITVSGLPFKSACCGGCKYLMLYNQTGDFEATWTDIYVA